MKILLVTGRKAADALRKAAVSPGLDVRIHVCDSDVAALLSIGGILKELSGTDLSGVSLVMLPGNVRGDARPIADGLGVACVKGPSNLADLSTVLEGVSKGKVRLSTIDAAEKVLESELIERASKEVSGAYKKPKEVSIRIGKKSPVYLGTKVSHVMAEIIDAPLLSEEELIKAAKYYVESGAEIIDIGMCAGKNNAKKVQGIVETLRSAVDAPLSVDSLDESEILAALDAKIDLILSIDETNKGLQASITVPYVLIPRDKDGVVPGKAEDRLRIMDRLLGGAKKDAVVDLVLNPVNFGFTESLKAYSFFRDLNPKVPMLMGAGNVTELMDIDSVGINGLLAGLASELSVDLLLTTEASNKTRGCVKELRKSSEMMYLSSARKQAPKDLGIDLLMLKDKEKKIFPEKEFGLKKEMVAQDKKVALEDSMFEIYLSGGINVIYYKGKKPLIHLSGDSADRLYKEILGRGLTKDALHAAYLGKELAKAEIALKIGKNYVQDEPLF